MQDSDSFTHVIPGAGEPLADLLDLSRFVDAGCVLVLVEKVGAALRLNFEWDDVGEGSVSLSADHEELFFISTGNIAVRFGGTEVTRPWAVLMARIAASAGQMTIAELTAVAELAVARSAENAIEAQQPYNPIQFWAPGDGWRQFMCEAAMERRFG